MKRVLAVVALLSISMLLSCSRVAETTAPLNSENQKLAVPADLQQQLEQYMPIWGGHADLAPTIQPYDTSVLRDTSYDVYGVVVLWGRMLMMPMAPMPPFPPIRPTDWSGSLSINVPERIDLVHTISFEPKEDSTLPSPRPGMIAWVSRTTFDFDGVATLLFIKRGVATLVVPQLSFDTKPFSLQIDVSKLVAFSALYQVDSGNAVAICARKLSRNACPGGTLAGAWIRDSSKMSGKFGGKWLAEDGTPIGSFDGTFGPGPATLPGGLFTGVRSDLAGNVVGHLKGSWFYDDPAVCPICGTRFGKFFGLFTDSSGTVKGKIEGKFGDMNSPTVVPPLALPLTGRWQTYCPKAGDGNQNVSSD